MLRLWPRAYRSALPGARPVERLDALLGESPLYELRVHTFAGARLELHVVHGEWNQPPLAVAVFDGVELIQLPRASDRFRRARVTAWASAERALAPRFGDVFAEAGAQLFAFEPAGFDEVAGYVIAQAVQVAVPA